MMMRILLTVALCLSVQLGKSTPTSGPCYDETNRVKDTNAWQPECTSDGFYHPRQCRSADDCWCVGQCGDIIPGTDGDSGIKCEEEPAPCMNSAPALIGEFRPRCHPDGYYYHTQCRGSGCYCTDKCGHTVPGSNHHISRIRDFICACPNDDHAYNCPVDPCEGAFCNAYPDAVCTASICGGCKAEFSVDGTVVDCNECTDINGNKHANGDRWKMDKCTDCTCFNGMPMCASPMCAGPPHPACEVVDSQDSCCPTYECPNGCFDTEGTFHDAGEEWNPDVCTTCMCVPGEGITEPICAAVMCAMPSNPLCEQEDVEGQCCPSFNCPRDKISSRLRDLFTAVPTTFPQPTTPMCPMITCSNACVSGKRRIIDGCRTCECLDQTTTYKPKICVDDLGNNYPVNAVFEQDCQVCTCTESEEIFCLDKPCPPPRDDPPSGCRYVVPPGGCDCPTRLACMESLSNCPVGVPVAMCGSNECLTATCERYPDAMCSLSFCGNKACQATFYDEDGKELECSAADDENSDAKIPSDLRDPHTVIPTTPPTTTSPITPPCPMLTCSIACGSAGQRVIKGCPVCECVDQPSTTVTTIPPTTTSMSPTTPPCHYMITCFNGCGFAGRRVINGCMVCECMDHDRPSTTVTPTPTMTPTTSPCPMITCSNACGSAGRRVINGCRTCECVEQPTTVPAIECVDSNKETHPLYSEWKVDACTDCTCVEGGEILCATMDCYFIPPYCTQLPADPDTCCPDFTCPEGCVDSLGNFRSINEDYQEGCQTCTCTPFGEPFCLDTPCPPPRDDPPSGCQYVTPPNGCCPTRLACMESLSNCPQGVPVAMCGSNECLTATCQRYPDAMCSISFCGNKACQATFYDEDGKELECSADAAAVECIDSNNDTHPIDSQWKVDACTDCVCMPGGEIICAEIACDYPPPYCTPLPLEPDACCPGFTCPEGCVDDASGKFYKTGDAYNDGCNDCTCMEDGNFACTEKYCGCVDEATGKFYKTGDSYNDGCNDCTCMEDGNVACTEKYCGCVDEATGTTYKVGDSFNDGCNDCLCTSTGLLACTKKYCFKEPIEVVEVEGPQCNHWEVEYGLWSSRPRCKPDGTYSPKQCSEDGSCWCVDITGVMVEGSLLLDGALVECETGPSCQIELDLNQQKVDQGQPLTSDPSCDKDGYYEPEQCDPNSNQCWCSERDGTVVPGSHKSRGENLKCSKVCFGKIPLLLSKCNYHSGCPNRFFCHHNQELGFARCCHKTEP